MDDDAALRDLADRAFSYTEIGATGHALPEDARHIGRDAVVGRGEPAFHAAGRHLMTWGMHRDAGFRVASSSTFAERGVDVALSTGPTWRPIVAPCRVVHTVAQPDRIGFTYGTLVGHPFSGEESFSVLITPDEQVRFVVIGFSRPGSALIRAVSPVVTRVADRITDRYVDAIRAAATR